MARAQQLHEIRVAHIPSGLLQEGCGKIVLSEPAVVHREQSSVAGSSRILDARLNHVIAALDLP